MKVVIDKKKIDELLTRGVDKIYPSRESLEQVLLSGKKLKLYQGFDPTGDKLHLGHMVGLMKHRQWQDLGHEVIFLIGDGTGEAGDPTGKKKTREKFFTGEELRDNAKGYITQASKIVRFDGPNPVKILYNGDWLNKLTKTDILNIAQHFSVQQLIERDMFQERLKDGESINLREFLYPILQAYDSVAMDVDLEIGGSDQTFNMLCGRSLMKAMKHKEKFVMTTPLIADKTGKKIGKTEGNVIAINDAPQNLFGEIMALPDEVILQCFECLTLVPMDKIKTIKQSMANGENPMTYKKQLAFEIVAELHDKKSAQEAEKNFTSTFQKKETPEEMTELKITKQEKKLVDILMKNKIVSSKSDFRRLIKEGAITDLHTEEKITDMDFEPNSGSKFKIGKKRFVGII